MYIFTYSTKNPTKYSYKGEDLTLPQPSEFMGYRWYGACTYEEGFENVSADAIFIPKTVSVIDEHAGINMVVIGYSDSEAEKYAQKHNLMFVDADAYFSD